MDDKRDAVPVPDPTTLTTDQLDKIEERLNSRMDERLAAQNRLMDEMFLSVNRRFLEIDSHRREQKQDTTKALDAALNAATAQIAALSVRVDDNRDRITQMAALLEGKQTQVSEARSTRDATGQWVAIGIAAIAALVGLVGFIVAMGSTP